ncbi:transposase [Paenibacillus lautus]|uniref:transposase n=1 Tax=Paenibacillus lautus TaxID=1401 RepID=UPI002DC0535A|nr:transposase [Paenibacillus lautus]MEC0253629.1 transposase [Paenibacillus lautus]
MTERYSEEFKQEILRRLAAGETPRALAEETGAKRRTLEHWRTVAKKQNTITTSSETEPQHETERKTETEELHRILEKYVKLEKAYADLKERYDSLNDKHNALNDDYKSLNDKHNALNDDYKSLKEDNDFLFNRYSVLRERM